MVNLKKLNKALAFVKNKDFQSADIIYAELLREYPNDETLLSFWGMYNVKKGLYQKAEKILERAYEIKKTSSTIAGLAYTKYKIQKYDDAVILYEELFKYDKDGENIYQKIIQCFNRLKMYNFAIAYCKKYLASHPNSREALSLTTQIYMNMGEYKVAEEYCAKTMELYPDNPSSWINAGLLQELFYNNEEMAQECYKTAIENKEPQGFYHLAVSLQKSGNKKDAEKYYKKMLEIFPNEVATKGSLGCLYLSQRKFKQGYELFIQREEFPDIKKLKNRWKGFDINKEAKSILVYGDQGLGDGIMFSRYIPYLKNKFEKVYLYVAEPLKSVLQKSFANIEITNNLSNIQYDISVLLVDLPYFLNMDFSQIPARQGYLKVNDNKILEYKSKYFKSDKLKVGLCWKAGGMAIRSAINRTINIEYFKNIFNIKNVEFYSLQKGDIFDALNKYPNIIDIANTFSSLEDTAAAIKNLDLVISVDTVVAHLSGAIGVNTKLLIPYCSDWRWFDNTEKTEWYNSVELIKQQDRQDWFIEADILEQKIKTMI